MNTILEGYFPDEVIAEQTGYTVRSIRRIRANSPDAPPHIRVKKKPLSKLQDWRAFFEGRTCYPNSRRQSRPASTTDVA
jgi:hypothetical protein